jgi:site-specific DNA-methyltransferase (adenine-specific)
MKKETLFSSATDLWETPQDFYDSLNREFSFTLDPCATDQNHKCEKYYTREQDGLKQSWAGERVFVNPPYGRMVSRWVRKCFDEVYTGDCRLAVMLLAARTDTTWFHDYIYHKAEVRFIRGRLKFGDGKERAPFPSMVVIFKGIGGHT